MATSRDTRILGSDAEHHVLTVKLFSPSPKKCKKQTTYDDTCSFCVESISCFLRIPDCFHPIRPERRYPLLLLLFSTCAPRAQTADVSEAHRLRALRPEKQQLLSDEPIGGYSPAQLVKKKRTKETINKSILAKVEIELESIAYFILP